MESMFVFELTALGGFLLACLGVAGFTLYTGKKIKYGLVYGLMGMVAVLLFILFFAQNPETWDLILLLIVAVAGVAIAVVIAVPLYLQFVLK
jgi:hypothetical protein